ncbi:hypothetical protein DB347_13315 [Opitutaceae bacterium EW11]|nr:hypothetical protein DB347_13315 [Opitutaceae bacterium EW11]
MMKSKRLLSTAFVLGAILATVTLAPARAADAEFDQRPVPVKTPPPEYPAAMRQEGVAGTVAVKVVVDETGAVTECTVSKSTNRAFEEPALAAVRTWKFKPATKDGTPVKARFILPIQFNLES